MRLQTVGMANGHSYELPITQSDVAETVGLTLVHINRVLQRLRATGLITRNKRLVINDAQALKEFGEKTESGRRRQMDAKIEPADELASLFEDLQDSEINGEIGWFFDGVWRAKIGDPWKGYCAAADGLPSFGEAARWLCDQALHLYPDSDFAKEYLRTHPGYRAHFP
jgi:DNA-binding MarR family transcriptional regulator